MSCQSPSIERIVHKSEKAKKQIEKLVQQMIELDQSFKDNFSVKIEEQAEKAKIDDFRELVFNSGIKTEYAHEFNLDRIAPVISKTLEAIANSLTGSVLQIITSPKAINSYASLVLSITEAAKSKSEASNSLSFSAMRIAPGIFAYLTAHSISIQDIDTFGEESVTATSVIYSLKSSVTDLKKSAHFNSTLQDAELLARLRKIQIGYTDELAQGKITVAVYQEKFHKIQEEIDTIQNRINSTKFSEILANVKSVESPVDYTLFDMSQSRSILEQSIKKFENRSAIYKSALHNTKQMLNKTMLYSDFDY